MARKVDKCIFSLNNYDKEEYDYEDVKVIKFDNDIIFDIIFNYIDCKNYNYSDNVDEISRTLNYIYPDLDKDDDFLFQIFKKGQVIFSSEKSDKGFKNNIDNYFEDCDVVFEDFDSLYLINLNLSDEDFIKKEIFKKLTTNDIRDFLGIY